MTEKGARFATSDDILEVFCDRHPIIDLILEHRELDKIRGTYTEALPRLADSESRLHPRFNVTVAATGRLSASYVQTIPTREGRTKFGKQVRNAFWASPGCSLVQLDLEQSEMRWAAHGSRDKNMIDVFLNKEDIHTKTACAVFGRDYATVTALPSSSLEYKRFKQEERLPSKTLGFGVLYGVSPPGLQKQIVLAGGPSWTEDQCSGFIDKFFNVYPGLRAFMELQYRRAKTHGLVWCAFGRPRLVPEGKSSLKWIVSEGLRKAGNHYEQASSQGNIKVGMAELNPLCRELSRSYRCWPLLQIHDAILLDVDNRLVDEFRERAKGVIEGSIPEALVPMTSSSERAERWGEM
jgi:DNA polymerase-1